MVKNFGRGLITKNDTAYEFQTANISDLKQLNNVIKSGAEQLNQAYTVRAKKIKRVPEIVDVNKLITDEISLTKLPIGYDINTKDVYNYNFTNSKFNMILGKNLPKHFAFVMALIKMIKNVPDINFKIIDFVDALSPDIDGAKVIKNNFDNEIAIINNEIVNEGNSNLKNIYMVVGASGLVESLSPNAKAIINNLFMASATFKQSCFIFIDNYEDYKKLQLEPWYQSQVDSTSGIWLGNEVGTQMAINASNLSLEDKKQNYEFMGVSIIKGEHVFIKYSVDMGDEQ